MTDEGSRRFSPWTAAEFGSLLREVGSESDRGCVLLSAAMLDRVMEKLLRVKFRSMSKASEKELDGVLTSQPSAPLLGFASKARVSHLLGLITQQESQALRNFAKIRNDFAHKDILPPLEEATLQPVIDALGGGWPGMFAEFLDPEIYADEDSIMGNMTPGRRMAMWIVVLLEGFLDSAIQKVIQGDQAPGAPDSPQAPPET